MASNRRTFNNSTFSTALIVGSLLSFSSSETLWAQASSIAGPSGSVRFGTVTTILKNGNIVVSDPQWSGNGLTNAGAVHVYDGKTLSRISTLRGSHNQDSVGSGGITVLSNGNFVVVSPFWNGPLSRQKNMGAVTWINGNTGLNDTVSSTNSITGNHEYAVVGFGGVHALSNGNFVVLSPFTMLGTSITYIGVVTWGNGFAGTSGQVAVTNSLTGFIETPVPGQNPASLRLTELTNGNYVIRSDYDANGWYPQAGAVTWCDGLSGLAGFVDSTNSIVGSSMFQEVGGVHVTPLSNGNYVVCGYHRFNGIPAITGSVTWGDGLRGTHGVVSASNSVLSTPGTATIGDAVPLANGNYVIPAPGWGGSRGAARLCSGTMPSTGQVDSTNSLVGSQQSDQVGNSILPLPDSNYVVLSKYWSNGAIQSAGAATWVDGNTGLIGKVSTVNSLVGGVAGAYTGNEGFALKNGGFLIQSYGGTGALTLCNAVIGRTGIVDSTNSIIGGRSADFLPTYVLNLDNGNVVVSMPSWKQGTVIAGAVTWMNGITGRHGRLDSSTSLIGVAAYDHVGDRGAIPLKNGHYVVKSGSETSVTWGNGNTGVRGTVHAGNSLLANAPGERIGSAILPLENGHYVVAASGWKNDTASGRGAFSWRNGVGPSLGSLDESNSIIGDRRNDLLGTGAAIANPDSTFIIMSSLYDGPGQNSGAVTYGDGGTTISGRITNCNSLLGPAYNNGAEMQALYHTANKYVLVAIPSTNRLFIYNPRGQALAGHLDSSIRNIATPVGGRIHFVDSAGCSLIASLHPQGHNSFVGKTRALNYLWPVTPHLASVSYVRRHLDLRTAKTDDSSNGRLTLYLTQADLSDYNAADSLFRDLPAGSGDTAGIAALRVVQEYGESVSGLPGTFTTSRIPGSTVHNPKDSDVIWNAVDSRWEISIDVKGGGGFFILSGIQAPVGVDEIHANGAAISVSPNPASASIRVDIKNPTHSPRAWKLLDLTGRTIQAGEIRNRADLDLSTLVPGMYYLRVDGYAAAKVLKS